MQIKLPKSYFQKNGYSAENNDLNKIANNARGLSVKVPEQYFENIKKEKKNTDLNLVYDGLEQLEKGPLVKEHKNPLAVLYTDELKQKFGAMKGKRLPAKDNPENRELFTARFVSEELGKKAGQFIIDKIYENVGGDMRAFSSVYPLGKLPSQLTSERERIIANRYFEKLTNIASTDDLEVTIKNQQNDVSSAVLEEIDRLKSSKLTFDDLSKVSIFAPTKVDKYSGIQGETQNNKLTYVKKDFEKKSPDINLTWDEDINITKSTYDKKLNLPELDLIDEVENKRNKYSLSTMPNLEGANRWGDILQNVKNATVGYMTQNNLTNAYDVVGRPNARELGNLLTYAVANTLDIGIGLGRGIDAFSDAVFKGEFGPILEEVAAYHDFLMLAAPQSIVNLITATGVSPDPRKNLLSDAGKEEVKKARTELAQNPLMPIFASLAIKGATKSPNQIKKLSTELNKTYNESIKPLVDQNIKLVKLANKVAKKEIALEDASPTIKKISEQIKDTQAMDIAISLAESDKLISNLTSLKENKLNTNVGLDVNKTYIKGIKESEFYTGDIKKLPILDDTIKRNKNNVDLPASVSDEIFNNKKEVTNKQIRQAYQDFKDLTRNIANTRKKLDDPNLTDNSRSLHENSLKNATDLLIKNLDVLGQENALTYFNMGFPLLSPKQQRQFLRTVKLIKDNVKLKDAFDEDALSKIIQTGFKPSVYVNKNIKTQYQDDLHKQIDSNNTANKLFLESQSSTKEFKLDKTQFLYDTIGSKFFSPSLGVNRRLKKLVDEDNTELAKKVRSEKDALINSGTDINVRYEHNASKIFGGLNTEEYADLINYINVRKTNQLYQRKTQQVNETYPNKIQSAKDKTEKNKLQEKLRNAKKMISNLENGKINTYVRSGAPEEFLKTVKNPDLIKLRADAFFAYNRELVDMRRAANLINDETADAWKAFDYDKTEYLYEVLGTKEYTNAQGKKVLRGSNGVRAMKVGDVEHVLNDPLLTMQHNLTAAINTIKTNNANLALKKLLESKPLNVTYKSKKYETTGIEGIGFIPKKNKIDKSKYNEIEYFNNGIKESFALDKRFSDGWLTRGVENDSKLVHLLGWVSGAKPFQLTTTGVNAIMSPMFFALDVASVMATQHQYSSVLPKRMQQMFYDYKEVMKDAALGSKSPLAREAAENGITFHTLSRQSRIPLPKFARKGVENLTGFISNTFDKKLKAGSQKTNAQFVKSGLDAYNIFTYGMNDFFENWTRLALYNRGLKNGLSKQEAARQASTGYIVFNDAGDYAKKINNVVPYFSASMAASKLLARTIKEKPVETAKINAQIGAATFISAYLLNEYWFDKDTRNVYDRIPERDKLNYYVVPTGTTRLDENGLRRDEYIKLFRKDDFSKYISLLTEMSYSYAFDKDVPEDYYYEEFMNLLTNNYSMFAQLPPYFKALTAMTANKTSYGSDIYRGEKNVLPFMKYNADTENLYRDIGKLFNKEPAQLQYSSEQYLQKKNIFTGLMHGGYSMLRNKSNDEDKASLDDTFNEFFDNYGLREIRDTFIGQANTMNLKDNFRYRKMERNFNSRRKMFNTLVDQYLINIKNEPDEDIRIDMSKRFALLIENIRKDFGDDEVTRVSNYLQKQYGKNKNEISRSLYQSGYDKAPHIKAMLIVDNVQSMQASEKAMYNMLEDVYDLPNFLSKETIEEANKLLEERYKEGYLKYKIKLNPKKRK